MREGNVFSLSTPVGGGYPGQVQPGAGGGTPASGGGYPHFGKQMEYLIRHIRYASCVHAGGLSCYVYFLVTPPQEWTDLSGRYSVRPSMWLHMDSCKKSNFQKYQISKIPKPKSISSLPFLGQPAFRGDAGSDFIQTACKVIREMGDDEDVLSVTKEVRICSALKEELGFDQLYHFIFYPFLPPAYVVRREGTVFTGVCLSTGGEGGSGYPPGGGYLTGYPPPRGGTQYPPGGYPDPPPGGTWPGTPRGGPGNPPGGVPGPPRGGTWPGTPPGVWVPPRGPDRVPPPGGYPDPPGGTWLGTPPGVRVPPRGGGVWVPPRGGT